MTDHETCRPEIGGESYRTTGEEQIESNCKRITLNEQMRCYYSKIDQFDDCCQWYRNGECMRWKPKLTA